MLIWQRLLSVEIKTIAITISCVWVFSNKAFDRAVGVFKAALGFTLMMQSSFKHRNGSLIEVKATLFYCFKKPDLGSLKMHHFHFVLTDHVFRIFWWIVLLILLRPLLESLEPPHILLSKDFKSLTNLFNFRSDLATHPNSSFHILPLVINLLFIHFFDSFQLHFEFAILLFHDFSVCLQMGNYHQCLFNQIHSSWQFVLGKFFLHS